MTIMASSQYKKSLHGLRSNRDFFLLLAQQVGKIVTPTKAQTTPVDSIHTTPVTIPPLLDFIGTLVHRSCTRTGTLLVALILLTRLSQRLGHVTTGMASAPQRILLASLIVSTKLIHDTSPKNKHWKEYASNYFELNEINLMEKQFLTLMDFNLSISKTDFQNAVNWYQQCNCSNYIKTCKWWRQDDSPNRLVVATPSQNMVALAVNNKKKNKDDYIVNKKVLPPPSPTSTSSSSSLQSVSLSNTPIFDPDSTNNVSSAYSPLGTIHVNHRASCDVAAGSTWSHPTTFVTPLFSV
ncbi:hypothetical protein BCR42DRAFT_492707 [Absidia repens]|uniref:Cyclin N-terminal domain-containing protein n=1 Tax=Absidia repens TaxID=90262 RepID=A0A1X2ICS6_9FUNG|nr:hypothetical protein BCR42DRAFT_492707 [Absidia repens]